MAVSPPPAKLLTPMNFPMKLLMGPGPSNCSPRVLAASALPLLGHLHPEFVQRRGMIWMHYDDLYHEIRMQIMDEVKEGIQYAFQTRNKLTLAISGTGHAAMEAACCNLVEPGDKVLVACTGIWGDRFSDMSERHGAVVSKMVKPPGGVLSLTEIETNLKSVRPAVMFITQGESSSATLQPLEGIGALCHRYRCLLVVDSVASMGGVPLFMDEWEIDVLYSGAQKVLSAPPGASPISFSPLAWEKIQKRKSKVRSFYFDMNWLANYWGCDGQPRKYHHTGPISSVYALREGLAMLAEEGLESCWDRHRQCALILHKGLGDLGLDLFVKDPAHRLPTVTAVVVPPGVHWKDVTDYAMQKYKLEISGGLGATAGKVWRVGLMGYNATPDNARRVLRVLREGLAARGATSKL